MGAMEGGLGWGGAGEWCRGRATRGRIARNGRISRISRNGRISRQRMQDAEAAQRQRADEAGRTGRRTA